MTYILAFDQGTTSSRSIVFDVSGKVVSVAQQELSQIFPQPGHVEHSPEEIFSSQIGTAAQALQNAGLTAADIAAVGITNQRETTLIWDRRTGVPVYNAIVWQDRRTSDWCRMFRESHGEMIRNKTGLECDAYFSASKIVWLLDNVPNAREMSRNGELAFGTVDSWLVYRLTSGRLHITDVSNASRTMLFNISNGRWDDELLDISDIPHTLLPEVRPSSGHYGLISLPGDLEGIEIGAMIGDQQAALFGQACFETGTTKNTYGTGCFMLQNIGELPVVSENRLLTTVAWQVEGKTEYALEGSVFIGGAVVQWLRDGLGIIADASDVEELARSVEDNGGVYFVPAFAGLGTPYWDQQARGIIAGLSRGVTRGHIARAALESIAFQTADLLIAMKADSGIELPELRVDGGAARNDLLLQFQADILQIPVVRPAVTETTALGAAYLAGLAVGFWKDRGELAAHWAAEKVYYPEMPLSTAKLMTERWHEAVRRSLNWAE